MQDIPPGIVIAGRYRVGVKIGHGELSAVHEGFDRELQRRVALKLSRASGATPAGERKRREALACGLAEHPGIVRIYDFGTDDLHDLDYLVLEFLEGENLKIRIEKGALAPDFVVRIGIDIADALAHVHKVGIVHRDLTPSNVFLARFARLVDQVKLLDFGICRHQNKHPITGNGESLGTPLYMAPEQFTGSGVVTPCSDIYTLGLTLRECLTGEQTFVLKRGGDWLDLIPRVVGGHFALLRVARPALPQGLAKVVDRCTQLRPSDRYQSANAIVDDLLDVQTQLAAKSR